MFLFLVIYMLILYIKLLPSANQMLLCFMFIFLQKTGVAPSEYVILLFKLSLPTYLVVKPSPAASIFNYIKVTVI